MIDTIWSVTLTMLAALAGCFARAEEVVVPASAASPRGVSSGEGLAKVAVSGQRSKAGQMCLFVWDSADQYKRLALDSARMVCRGIESDPVLIEVPVDRNKAYAFLVVHDENSNGKLDTNFIGMPKEGIAFSNNAKGRFGSPSWDQAAFQLSNSFLEMPIKLIYL